MNNFALTYNPFSLTPSAGQIDNHVKINRAIEQYYQPYPGTYLLKSKESVFTLNETIKGFFEHSSYMLIHYDASYANGRLPQEIWDWINFGFVPVAPALPPAPSYDPIIDALRNLGAPPSPPK